MTRLTRRQFLVRSGASVAGTVLAASLADRLLAATTKASPATVSADATTRLADQLATIVADLERKYPYASALYSAQTGIGMSIDRKGKRVSESGFPTQGVCIRVFDGSSFHEMAVGSTSPDDIAAAAKSLRNEVTVGKQEFKIGPMPAHSQVWRTTMEKDPAGISLSDRLALLEREFARANWDDPRVKSVRVSTDVGDIRRIFVDRNQRLTSLTTTIAHNLLLFGFDQGKPGFGFTRRVGQAGLELATFPDAQLERVRKEFVESFGAEQVPAGEYEVVFAPSVTGLLAHESFGHGVEMDQFVKQRAKAAEFLGKPVASKIVTLLDDPSMPGKRGSYPFDDEGLISSPTTIIENGVFVQPLTDLMSATFLTKRRTPNGRTQAWDRKVYARMSNTFIANGTSDPAEVLGSLKDGLYLEGFRNGIEDPQGWGIQFTADTAREYKNGKPTGRLFAPATVTGYVPEILSNITMVANDLDLVPGTCGKGFKEWVPVTSGGPHIRTKARVS
jgi:TldD protein